ncbi:Pseudouridine synthase I TruA alpha/beta domain [Trinorchestia longiramus]|nr:Pseudouridine synthase I TruA alpha/beta domain [Trinorchestia longiramus]
MLAWCPAPPTFSARFDCLSRTYKYFFPLGALNLQRMRDAGKLLEGHHDFRNFCKMDVGNGVVNFERHIDRVSIEFLKDDSRVEAPLAASSNKSSDSNISGVLRNHDQAPQLGCSIASPSPTSGDALPPVDHEIKNDALCATSVNKCSESATEESRTSFNSGLQCPTSAAPHDSSAHIGTGYEMCVATISGKAFLWHQVRAIMAILLLVGLGKEEPTVVSALLDVKKHPRKPQYSLANEVPLCLFTSEYPADVVQWTYSSSAVHRVQSHMQRLWAHHAVRSSMLERMLCDLACVAGCVDPVVEQHAFLAPTLSKQYRPLLQRKTCESLETRVRHFVKRRRLDAGVLDLVKQESQEDRGDDDDTGPSLDLQPPLSI